MKIIYLAGGCFWGVEHLFSHMPGVVKTVVGYANGHVPFPSYQEVCGQDTGHAETVKITYREEVLPLARLLGWFYQAIDPTAVNRQGPDIGPQYRAGIYYTDAKDRKVIEESLKELEKSYLRPLSIEIGLLQCFYPAEDEHQKYLVKHPGGYCHISNELIRQAVQSTQRGNIEERMSD